MTGLLFMWIFLTRFIIEFIKDNQVTFQKSLPLTIRQYTRIQSILLCLITLG
ncbi:MAG: hypothetical protein IPJ71_11320 [Bdellovibrionales bacterium]|nr:hypothetical protein [Bdellovibrionales bacterium]